MKEMDVLFNALKQLLLNNNVIYNVYPKLALNQSKELEQLQTIHREQLEQLDKYNTGVVYCLFF